MKVLFATSEAAPFVKTGGLGDVAFDSIIWVIIGRGEWSI